MKEIYTFGTLTLNTSLRYLQLDRQVNLSPKCTQVFALLAEESDKLVTKDYLLESVWPGRFGADESLTRAISDIRKALKDIQPGAEKAIKTVPKRGYMLNTEVLEKVFYPLPQQGSEPSDNPNKDNKTSQQTHSIFKRKSIISRRAVLLSVAVLSILGAFAYVFYYKFLPQRIDSVAVLPFEAIGAEQDLETLAKGLGNELAMQISFKQHIKVASPMAVDRMDLRLPLDEIADALDVSHIITGSVDTFTENKTISISLVHADTQKILWTEQHRFENDKLLDIYKSVLTNFQYLGDKEALPIGYAQEQEIKPSAYANYLRGMLTFRSQMWMEWKSAVPSLEKALQIQPDFYPPMVSLAAYHALNAYFAAKYNELVDARQLLDRAQALGASDAEYFGAEAIYQLACASAPTADKSCSMEQSISFIDKSIELAPQYWAFRYVKGLIFQTQGDLARALELYQQSNQLDPKVIPPYVSISSVHAANGDTDAYNETQEKLYTVLSQGTSLLPVSEKMMELFQQRAYFDAYVFAYMIEDKVANTMPREHLAMIAAELGRENGTRWIAQLPPFEELGPFYELFRLGYDDPEKAIETIFQIDENVDYRSWLSKLHAEIMLKFASNAQLQQNYERLLHAFSNTNSGREFTFRAYLAKRLGDADWSRHLQGLTDFKKREDYPDFYDFHLAHAEAAAMENDFEKAFEHLAKLEKDAGKSWYLIFSPFRYWESPMLKNVSNDPRFIELINREKKRTAEINSQIDAFLVMSSREQRRLFETIKDKHAL